MRLHGATRNAVAARFTSWRVPLLSTLPALILLSGHSGSQEANCFSGSSGSCPLPLLKRLSEQFARLVLLLSSDQRLRSDKRGRIGDFAKVKVIKLQALLENEQQFL